MLAKNLDDHVRGGRKVCLVFVMLKDFAVVISTVAEPVDYQT